MKTRTLVSLASLVLLLSASLVAQDPVQADPTDSQVILENPTVRVLKISYPPGATSTMHKHPDSLVVSLAGSNVRFQDGKSTDQNMPSESAMYAPAGKPADFIIVANR